MTIRLRFLLCNKYPIVSILANLKVEHEQLYIICTLICIIYIDSHIIKKVYKENTRNLYSKMFKQI